MLGRTLLLVLWAALLAGAAGARVEFKANAEVNPGPVRLSDIADIEGDDTSLVRRLGNLEVARVDKPGRTTRVSAGAVKGFFVRQVADPGLVEFSGEGSVMVRARAGSVGEDSLVSLLHAAVRGRMGVLEEGEDWALEAGKLPHEVDMPVKGGKVEVTLSPRFAGRGQETDTIKTYDGDQLLANRQISFKVRRWESVVRLKNALRKGEAVRGQDVELVREETTFQQRKVLKALDAAVGRNTIRAVRAGDLLVDNWLETPYAVREGERVRLMVQVGGLVVQTAGVAQKNAFRGQTIEVENADTRKILQAKVSGPGEAWVLN